MDITSSREEAKRFLKKKGNKIAIQIGYGGTYVFAEKTDFIHEVIDTELKRGNEEFINYDGKPEYAFVVNNVLHIPVGLS